MNKHPTHASFGITSHSTGLTPAHRELIKLLAAVAVKNYLAEVEVAETAPQAAPANDRQAVTR